MTADFKLGHYPPFNNGLRLMQSVLFIVMLNPSEFPALVQAVLVCTGSGEGASPRRDDSSLVTHFGPEAAPRLICLVKSLEQEFYSSDAWKNAADLKEMGEMAAEQFKRKYPEIPDQVVQAFSWWYTYDYK